MLAKTAHNSPKNRRNIMNITIHFVKIIDTFFEPNFIDLIKTSFIGYAIMPDFLVLRK